jgi:ABC-2 type transport system permease protein
VAYSAGAVAVLFLLLSAVHGALSLVDERESGILDRVLAGPGGTGPLLRGKLLFLVLLGFAQVSVIFLAAWLLYGVDLPGHLAGFAVTTLAAAAAGAGLALLLTCASRTRRQAQTLSNVVVLIVSAVGGSMVPRFFMPPALQQLGWLTPTTWALEAYTAVFWRGEGLAALVLPVGMLLGFALVATALATRLARRWEAL